MYTLFSATTLSDSRQLLWRRGLRKGRGILGGGVINSSVYIYNKFPETERLLVSTKLAIHKSRRGATRFVSGLSKLVNDLAGM